MEYQCGDDPEKIILKLESIIYTHRLFNARTAEITSELLNDKLRILRLLYKDEPFKEEFVHRIVDLKQRWKNICNSELVQELIKTVSERLDSYSGLDPCFSESGPIVDNWLSAHDDYCYGDYDDYYECFIDFCQEDDD
jgi:hypothetical protein